MSHDCSFCEIVRDPGQAHIVLSTPTLLVFLDRLPLTRGHLLIIPKLHYPHLPTFPAHVSATLGAIMPALSSALTRVLGVDDFNVILNNGERAGQTVTHVHWHMIPRPGDGKWNMFARGPRTQDLDDDEGLHLARQIRDAFRQGPTSPSTRPAATPALASRQSGLWTWQEPAVAPLASDTARQQTRAARMRPSGDAIPLEHVRGPLADPSSILGSTRIRL